MYGTLPRPKVFAHSGSFVSKNHVSIEPSWVALAERLRSCLYQPQTVPMLSRFLSSKTIFSCLGLTLCRGLLIGTASLSKSTPPSVFGEQAITSGLTPLLRFSRICLNPAKASRQEVRPPTDAAFEPLCR